MPKKKLNDMLNEAIAREIAVSIQYMWHHVMAKGINAPPVQDIFKEIAIVEMKHAEEIAERLDYLGGVPTTKPEPIAVGGTLEEMITANKKAEEDAIKFYKQIVKAAREAEDHTTRRLFEKILAEEEEHHNEFAGLLE